jgi:hypothetical protein
MAGVFFVYPTATLVLTSLPTGRQAVLCDPNNRKIELADSPTGGGVFLISFRFVK